MEKRYFTLLNELANYFANEKVTYGEFERLFNDILMCYNFVFDNSEEKRKILFQRNAMLDTQIQENIKDNQEKLEVI